MGLQKRYEYIGGSSRKFWEIDPVHREDDDIFVVRVKFGRIGTAGQTHTKIFSYSTSADRYRDGKIEEKLRKGYKLITPKATPVQKANPLLYIPTDTPIQKVKAACQHNTISRSGSTWKCQKCGDTVEFDKPVTTMETPEFETRVRRFFAGAA